MSLGHQWVHRVSMMLGVSVESCSSCGVLRQADRRPPNEPCPAFSGMPIEEGELRERTGQSSDWLYSKAIEENHNHPVRLLLEAYQQLVTAYWNVRISNPGKLTAASNAIRSLDNAIRAILQEEGIVIPPSASSYQ